MWRLERATAARALPLLASTAGLVCVVCSSPSKVKMVTEALLLGLSQPQPAVEPICRTPTASLRDVVSTNQHGTVTTGAGSLLKGMTSPSPR